MEEDLDLDHGDALASLSDLLAAENSAGLAAKGASGGAGHVLAGAGPPSSDCRHSQESPANLADVDPSPAADAAPSDDGEDGEESAAEDPPAPSEEIQAIIKKMRAADRMMATDHHRGAWPAVAMPKKTATDTSAAYRAKAALDAFNVAMTKGTSLEKAVTALEKAAASVAATIASGTCAPAKVLSSPKARPWVADCGDVAPGAALPSSTTARRTSSARSSSPAAKERVSERTTTRTDATGAAGGATGGAGAFVSTSAAGTKSLEAPTSGTFSTARSEANSKLGAHDSAATERSDVANAPGAAANRCAGARGADVGGSFVATPPPPAAPSSVATKADSSSMPVAPWRTTRPSVIDPGLPKASVDPAIQEGVTLTSMMDDDPVDDENEPQGREGLVETSMLDDYDSDDAGDQGGAAATDMSSLMSTPMQQGTVWPGLFVRIGNWNGLNDYRGKVQQKASSSSWWVQLHLDDERREMKTIPAEYLTPDEGSSLSAKPIAKGLIGGLGELGAAPIGVAAKPPKPVGEIGLGELGGAGEAIGPAVDFAPGGLADLSAKRPAQTAIGGFSSMMPMAKTPRTAWPNAPWSEQAIGSGSGACATASRAAAAPWARQAATTTAPRASAATTPGVTHTPPPPPAPPSRASVSSACAPTTTTARARPGTASVTTPGLGSGGPSEIGRDLRQRPARPRPPAPERAKPAEDAGALLDLLAGLADDAED